MAALTRTRSALSAISYGTNADAQFRALDPHGGKGYLAFDVTPALPPLLREEGFKKYDWPKEGHWAIAGDPDVPHYLDIQGTRENLKGIVGAENVTELEAFSYAVTRFVEQRLPLEEKTAMDRNGVEFILDLAELRVGSGLGSPVHLDWYPREGMVMVIPIYGERTRVFDGGVEVKHKFEQGQIGASLISAYGRWANFKDFDWKAKPVKASGTRDNKQGVTIPNGVIPYLRTRGKDIPADLGPQTPGVLPTVHQAGTGPRMVLVLNFSYRERSPQARADAATLNKPYALDDTTRELLKDEDDGK